MTSIADAYVELHVDGDHVEGEIRKSLKSAEGPASKDADRSGSKIGSKMAAGFTEGFSKIGDKTGPVFKNLKAQLGGLSSLKMPALAALIPIATSAVSALGGALTALTGSLVRASAASLSFVGVLGSLVQAKVVAGIAFKDFGKAVAGDEEALKALSPAARAAAEAATGLTDKWKGLRAAVQENVFAGLAGPISNIGNVLLPLLQNKFATTGTILNGMFKDLAGFATSTEGVRRFNTVLAGNNKIFKTLSGAAVPALRGILAIFAALQPSARRLAVIITDGAKAFGRWATESGRAAGIDAFMRRAQKSAGLLWRGLKNVANILVNVFGAAAPTGDGMLKTFAKATRELRKFTELASTKSAIADWAEQGTAALAKLGPILSSGKGLFKALFDPAIFSGFLDIINSMTPTLSTVFGVLQSVFAPILTQVAASFTEFGPKIAALFVALQPLLAGVGAVIGQIIKQAFELIGGIATLITPVVAIISNVLGPVLTKFAPVIAFLILGFSSLGAKLVSLVPVIGKFLAPVVQLAQWISGKVVPVLGVLGKIAGVVFRGMGIVIGTTMRLAGRIISTVWRGISATISGVLKVIRAIITTVFGWMKPYISGIFNAVKAVVSAVWGAIKSIVGAGVQFIKDRITDVKVVGTIIRDAFEKARTAVSEKIAAVLAIVRKLPANIKSGLASIGSLLYDSGKKVIEGLIKGILSKIADVKAAASKVANAVKDFFPFSPVKEGPLKAWNGGKPGAVLMDMLAMGIYSGLPAITAAAKTAAGGIEQGFATALVNGNLGAVLESVLETIKKKFEDEKISKAAAKAMTKTVKSVGKGLSSLVKEYEIATTKLQELRQSHVDMMSSISSSLSGELSLGDAKLPDIEAVEEVRDEAGNITTPAVAAQEGAFTFETVSSHIKTLAARISAFAGKLRALIAAGIPKELVQQVAALGSETGTKVADALLSGTGAQVGTLVSDWASLQGSADAAGKVLADAFYDTGIATGISAQEGIIKGLLDDDRLTDAASEFAKKLTKKIKKALGISSPSKLMQREVGFHTGTGVGVGAISGMDSMQNAVNNRAASLITPINLGAVSFDASTPAGAAASSAASAGGAGAGLTRADVDRLIAAISVASGVTFQLPTGDPEAAAMAVFNRIVPAGR